jgi:hypothetical protein
MGVVRDEMLRAEADIAFINEARPLVADELKIERAIVWQHNRILRLEQLLDRLMEVTPDAGSQ